MVFVKYHQMKNTTAHLFLLLSNTIWGCAYPLYHFVLNKYIDPLPLFTATILCSAIISLIPMLWGDREEVDRKDILSFIGAALLIAVVRKYMLMKGLSMTSPIDGSIIATIAPVVVLIISVIIGFESFTKRKLFGVLLGMCGAIGVIMSGNSGSHTDSGMVGNVMVLLCAFITALYLVWFKSLLKRYRPVTAMRWMFCIAAIIVLPIGFESMREVDYSKFDLNVWLAVGYLVIMPTYPPNILLTEALTKVAPTVSSVYVYTQPLVAVAISVIFGLDALRGATIIYAALIFSGVGVVISSPKAVKKVG